ncbi:MAG: hypothetical protein C0518_04765 [Opitutus sp.]|nr:hypothetical protein [Opitutus sp.]
MATARQPALLSPAATLREQRQCAPELLDSLPAESRDAVRSRRDLRRLNALMGNFAWFERTLRGRVGAPEKILELGAGTGELGLRLARRGFTVAAIDRAPRPRHWPASAEWHAREIEAFDRWADYPIVIGNLIFHHFDAARLRVLGQQLDAHARLILAAEPRRNFTSNLLFTFAATLIGANHVTRHDGRVSIDAGFHGDELAVALGLSPARWRWSAQPTLRGGYRLIAERKS